jgi:glucokinase
MRFGIDFGGTNLKAGIFDETGKVIAFKEQKLVNFTESGDLLTNLTEFAQNFTKSYPVKKGGLAIKGLVDTKRGVVLEDIGAGNLLAGKNLQQVFEQKLQIEFIIDNDARAYMLGEWKFGAGRGFQSMVCMTLGTGLGCSVITQGKPYYGSDVLGGLLGGHLSIDRNGPQCNCGNRGCLELYCSATALNKKIKSAIPISNEDALPEFFKMVERNDELACNILHSFNEDLSIGVVNIIHAFNPELIVIGGGVMNSSHLILPSLTDLVHQRAWTYPRNKVQIRAAELGNKAAAMGIAFHPEFEN